MGVFFGIRRLKIISDTFLNFNLDATLRGEIQKVDT